MANVKLESVFEVAAIETNYQWRTVGAVGNGGPKPLQWGGLPSSEATVSGASGIFSPGDNDDFIANKGIFFCQVKAMDKHCGLATATHTYISLQPATRLGRKRTIYSPMTGECAP